MTTVNERLTSIENDVNRIMEHLLDTITVEDASKHVEIADSEVESILYRIESVEKKLEALRYKWQLAYKRNN